MLYYLSISGLSINNVFRSVVFSTILDGFRFPSKVWIKVIIIV